MSWGQERLWEIYSRQSEDATRVLRPTLAIVGQQLHAVPRDERRQFVADLAGGSGVDLELFELQDIAGDDTLARLDARRSWRTCRRRRRSGC